MTDAKLDATGKLILSSLMCADGKGGSVQCAGADNAFADQKDLYAPQSLEVLLARVEKIVSKEAIIQAVAGWGDDLSPNAIEVYVSRLRSKLEPAGIKIRTVRGFGYMLEDFKES